MPICLPRFKTESGKVHIPKLRSIPNVHHNRNLPGIKSHVRCISGLVFCIDLCWISTDTFGNATYSYQASNKSKSNACELKSFSFFMNLA